MGSKPPQARVQVGQGGILKQTPPPALLDCWLWDGSRIPFLPYLNQVRISGG